MSQMLFDQRNGPSGNAISIDNIKNLGFIDTVQTNSVASGTFAPNFLNGSLIIVNITANAAITIGTPINMPVPFGPGATSIGFTWFILVQNASGGALTTGPAFSAIYRAGTVPAIANGTGFSVTLFWDGTHHTALSAISAAI
jgi:hypothetical protein